MVTSIFLFFVGSSIVSFLLLVIERREIEESFIFCRSHCTYCGKIIPFIYLVPVLNYFFLRRKSACCQIYLPLSYPIIESLGGVVCVIAYLKIGLDLNSFFYMFLFLFFIYLSIQDIRDLSVYTIDLLLLIIYVFLFSIHLLNGPFLYPIIAAGSFFFSLYFLLYNSFGFGDVLFCTALSFLHKDILHLTYTYMFGFIFASLYGIILIVKKKRKKEEKIPLIPFLSLGYFIHFLFFY